MLFVVCYLFTLKTTVPHTTPLHTTLNLNTHHPHPCYRYDIEEEEDEDAEADAEEEKAESEAEGIATCNPPTPLHTHHTTPPLPDHREDRGGAVD